MPAITLFLLVKELIYQPHCFILLLVYYFRVDFSG